MNESPEIWLAIQEFSGYEISNNGQLRHVMGDGRVRLLKGRRHEDGYVTYSISQKNKNHIRYAHRLVASAFLEASPDKPIVNHINGKTNDNRVENLEWTTHKDNINHALDIGLRRRGAECPFSKLNAAQADEIRASIKPHNLLAEEFGVSEKTVRNIRNRRHY